MASAKFDLPTNGKPLPVAATIAPPNMYAQAVADHQAGRLDAAEYGYREVLKHNPNHPDAMHLLGALELQRGNPKEAIALIRKALKIRPDMQPALYNLSRAYTVSDEPKAAARAAKRAWELAPDEMNAVLQRGSTLIALNKPAEALAFYSKAIKRHPKEEALWRSRALVLLHLKRYEDAAADFAATAEFSEEPHRAWRDAGAAMAQGGDKEGALPYLSKAYRLRPDDLDICNLYASMLLDLGHPTEAAPMLEKMVTAEPDNLNFLFKQGLMLAELNQHARALPLFERTYEASPDNMNTVLKLASTHHQLEHFDEAIELYEKLKRIAPEDARAGANLSAVYIAREDYERAFQEAKTAVEINPMLEPAHLNMGLIFQHLGDYDNAIHCYRRALEVKPDYHPAAANLAFMLLAKGNIQEGWDLFGHGFNSGVRKPMRHPRGELWLGEDCPDDIVLVWKEQGVGDDIRFASCFKDIIAVAKHVIIETDPRLVTLYQRSFPEATVRPQRWPGEEHLIGPPDFAKHTPAGQLPVYFRRSLDAFPKEESYLVPDPERVAYWRERVEACGDGIRIGLSWRSMKGGAVRERVYTKLEDWADLIATPGTTFINLQYDRPDQEVAEFEEKTGLKLHVFEELDLKDDLDEAAALTKACDLVISPGTSVADMAGAVGTPLLFYNDARHALQLGTDYFPWHPLCRYIGVERGQSVHEIVQQITAEVSAFAKAYANGELHE